MIKVGDIVTGYYKGFYKVTRVERRFYTQGDQNLGYGKKGDEYSPLLHGTMVLNSNYTTKGVNVQRCWDASYSAVVDLKNLRQKAENVYNETIAGIETLENIINAKTP